MMACAGRPGPGRRRAQRLECGGHHRPTRPRPARHEKCPVRRLRQRLLGPAPARPGGGRPLRVPAPGLDTLAGGLAACAGAFARGCQPPAAGAALLPEPAGLPALPAGVQPRGLRDHRLPGDDQRGQDQHRHPHGARHRRPAAAPGALRRIHRLLGRRRFHPCAAQVAALGPAHHGAGHRLSVGRLPGLGRPADRPGRVHPQRAGLR